MAAVTTRTSSMTSLMRRTATALTLRLVTLTLTMTTLVRTMTRTTRLVALVKS